MFPFLAVLLYLRLANIVQFSKKNIYSETPGCIVSEANYGHLFTEVDGGHMKIE